MDKIAERSSRKYELLRKLGNMAQIASIKPYRYTEGRCDQVKAFDIETGSGLVFTILESNCLDIKCMKYKGINISFLSKPGVSAPTYFDVHGYEYHRFFHAGMTYTCGLGNIGASCVDGETEYTFHGRISQTPAEKVSVHEYWAGDEYKLEIQGEMREASHYGENLVLRRLITTKMGSASFKITDTVENMGFEDQPVMIMYHINFGYPLLDEGSRILLPRSEVIPKPYVSKEGLDAYKSISAPEDGVNADVFYHRAAADREGYSYAGVVNEKLGLCAYEKYSTKNLPMLAQWKSMRSGEYALGLEPCSQYPENRIVEGKKGKLNILKPLESAVFELEIGVIEGQREIKEFENQVCRL